MNTRITALELKPDSSIIEIAGFLENALRSIRYGGVEITIHDGRIVQIERKEKLRLDAPSRSRRAPE